jgi:squalene synthase HpnC
MKRDEHLPTDASLSSAPAAHAPRPTSLAPTSSSPAPNRATPRQARRYCRRLARRHYENFTVASRLLPRRLRQHFANLYAYCRWADDLADESPDPQEALRLLEWWEGQLRECQTGRATHPVFIALAETIRRFNLPLDPFLDLLVAFRQDQRVARYETIEQVLEYCRWSANPVGRLVLMLGECCTTERMRLSDSVCTGLQLANFCQDVAGDWRRGRVYLPQDACRRHGFTEDDFARGVCNDAFRRLLAEHVDLAEGYLHAGSPLAAKMPPGLRLPVALFAAGGLAILEAIRRADYDVWTRRPTVSKWEKLRLVAKCWWELRRNARKR